MPPIPVHIDDPITPTKAQGVTPQTADQGAVPQGNGTAPTTTQQAPAYPQARPGAAAVPAPTPCAVPPPPAPSRTVPQQDNGPPAPQPGAVPVPYTQQAPSTMPPPPRPGQSSQNQQPPITTMPAQMNIPPPQSNLSPTHTTATTPSHPSGPTTVNLGPVSPASSQYQHLSTAGPGGYQQNAMAQEMSPAQRSSLEQEDRKGSMMAGIGGDSVSEVAGGVWSAVKGWVGVAGEKLAETERGVWERINGGK